MYCTNCGAKLVENSNFCSSCGKKVERVVEKEINYSSRPIESESANETVSETFNERANESANETAIKSESTDQKETDLTEVYVDSNYSFYKNKWEAMERKGSSVSGNFAAFFLGVFWLGYRKMYKPLLIIVGIYLLLDFLVIKVFNYQYSDSFIDPIDRIIGLITAIVLAIYGNTLYKQHVNKNVDKIKAKNLTIEQEEIIAKQKGGRSWLGVLLTAVIFFGYGIVSVLLFPSNQDHIAYVKDGSFYDYPTVTVGEAFDDYFDDGSWEYVSDNTPYDIVTFTGEIFILGNHQVEVEFLLDYTTDSFEIREVIIDGISLTSDDDIGLFIDEIFTSSYY